MKIKQVEELVGITSKNIRFYEEQGLLKPVRTENGYRDYKQSEIVRLKQIKLFRKLGVPVEEIYKLLHGHLTINECLERHTDILKKQQDNLLQMRALTEKMLDSRLVLESLDSDFWLTEIEKREKEGVNFLNVEKKDIRRKKTLGALIGAGIVVFIMLAAIAACIAGYLQDDAFPFWALLIMMLPMISVIIGAIAAVCGRIKEINKGEEDEAAKY